MCNNLEGWANLAQALATIFVGITFLISLSQWRQTVNVNRTSQYQAALQLMFEWRSDIISNPTLASEMGKEKYFAEVFAVAGSAPHYFHTVKLFHIFEHYWLLHEHGVIDNVMFEGWANNLGLLVSQTKNAELWRKVRAVGILNPLFVQHVEGRFPTLAPAKVLPVSSAVGGAGTT